MTWISRLFPLTLATPILKSWMYGAEPSREFGVFASWLVVQCLVYGVRRQWRSSLSACRSALENRLTSPTLLEIGMFQQLTSRGERSRKFSDFVVRSRESKN